MPWRLLVLLLAGQLLASMDASILTVAMPSLQREFAASPTMLQAIFAAYTFTFGVLVVTGARLGDDRGHGNMFLAGLLGFTLCSLACGLAPSAVVLLAGRLLQGACAALMTPQTLQVVQRRFEGAARTRAVGLYAMVLALGVLCGQLVGGVFVTSAGWRWALLVNVPLGSALLLASRRELRGEAPGRGKPLDVPGVALLGAAMALILAPLLLDRAYGWLAAGAAMMAAFVAYERRRPAPLLDLRVLPEVASGLVTVVAVMGCYAALLFALTLHLQNDVGYSPLHTGLAFAPYAVGFAAMSLTWRRLPPLGPLGPLAMAAGVAGVSLLHGWLEPCLVVAGAGHAAGYGPVAAETVARVRPEHAPEASALLTTAALLAQAVALATLGSLYLSYGLGWLAAGISAVCLVGAATRVRTSSRLITSP